MLVMLIRSLGGMIIFTKGKCGIYTNRPYIYIYMRLWQINWLLSRPSKKHQQVPSRSRPRKLQKKYFRWFYFRSNHWNHTFHWGSGPFSVFEKHVLLFSIFENVKFQHVLQGNYSELFFSNFGLVIPCRLFFSHVPVWICLWLSHPAKLLGSRNQVLKC